MNIVWFSALLLGLISLITGLFFIAKFQGAKDASGQGNQAEVVGGGFGIAIGSIIMLFAMYKLLIGGL